MKQVFDRGEEYGRFIHGSFGSGKSHFMTMLSLLVEGAQPAWAKFRPLFVAHNTGRESADHESWLAKAGLLVVRIHMLSVGGRSTGLDRAVYEGFNAALKRRGKAPFEFLNVEGILRRRVARPRSSLAARNRRQGRSAIRRSRLPRAASEMSTGNLCAPRMSGNLAA